MLKTSASLLSLVGSTPLVELSRFAPGPVRVYAKLEGPDGTSEAPCYRCLYPEPPPPGMVPSCAEGGVLGVLPGIVGSLQANEALKLLLAIGDTLQGRLLLLDALGTTVDEVAVRRDPACPVCGEHPTITEYVDYVEFCQGTAHA